MVGNKSSDKKTQDWRLHETEMCSQSKFDLNVYLELSILSLMYYFTTWPFESILFCFINSSEAVALVQGTWSMVSLLLMRKTSHVWKIHLLTKNIRTQVYKAAKSSRFFVVSVSTCLKLWHRSVRVTQAVLVIMIQIMKLKTKTLFFLRHWLYSCLSCACWLLQLMAL